MLRALSARIVAQVGIPWVLLTGRGAHAEETPGSLTTQDATGLLDLAYQQRAAGNLVSAMETFEQARAAGGDPQRIAMEIGYLALQRGDLPRAQRCFEEAERGPEATLARQARAERQQIPGPLAVDVYAEAYGFGRFAGATRLGDVVPTLRVRGFYRPTYALDVRVYGVGQATRDLASRGGEGSVLPQIYADNVALLGLGVMLRIWQRRIGLFAQAGAAIRLLDEHKERVTFEARAGAFLGLETAGCAPAPYRGGTLLFAPCAEVYADVVYVSRLDHNVLALARPRVAASYLVTGPVAWQLVAEGQVAKDRNNDYYNNFAAMGAAQRFRLLRPLRVDLMLGVHAGTYFGLAGRDPAPTPLGYAEVRLSASTYLEFDP